jgi:hypothetical protein
MFPFFLGPKYDRPPLWFMTDQPPRYVPIFGGPSPEEQGMTAGFELHDKKIEKANYTYQAMSPL